MNSSTWREVFFYLSAEFLISSIDWEATSSLIIHVISSEAKLGCESFLIREWWKTRISRFCTFSLSKISLDSCCGANGSTASGPFTFMWYCLTNSIVYLQSSSLVMNVTHLFDSGVRRSGTMSIDSAVSLTLIMQLQVSACKPSIMPSSNNFWSVQAEQLAKQLRLTTSHARTYSLTSWSVRAVLRTYIPCTTSEGAHCWPICRWNKV